MKTSEKLNLKSFLPSHRIRLYKIIISFSLQCEEIFNQRSLTLRCLRWRHRGGGGSPSMGTTILTGICDPALLCYPRNWTPRWLSEPWSASSIGWVLLVHTEEPRWQLCICRRNRLSGTRCKQTKRFKMQLNIYVHMESHFRIFLTQDAKINVWQFIAQSMLAFQGFELEFRWLGMVIYPFVRDYFIYFRSDISLLGINSFKHWSSSHHVASKFL